MFYRLVLFTIFVLNATVLANVFEKITSFEASFEQTITNASNSVIKYEGDIYVKDDSKILWQYKTPIIKNVYILGNFVIIDEPELEQAIYSKIDSEINLVKILQKSKKKSKNSYLATINEINYEITLKDNQISNISYKDELENSIKILFKNIKQNHNIQSDIFKYIPPTHYDIIRK